MTKKNIFDRLTLKKKISLNKQSKISNQLSSELEKNTQLIEQIKELQNDRLKDNTGTRSGYLLKSQNWYSQKLADELNQKQTKQIFIEKELSLPIRLKSPLPNFGAFVSCEDKFMHRNREMHRNA